SQILNTGQVDDKKPANKINPIFSKSPAITEHQQLTLSSYVTEHSQIDKGSRMKRERMGGSDRGNKRMTKKSWIASEEREETQDSAQDSTE
ncbi:hypothetical protein ABG768_019680, partial [Culter alburnus]